MLRKRLIYLLMVVLCPLNLAFGPPHLTESDDAQVPVYDFQLDPLAQHVPVSSAARGAVIMDLATGRTIYESSGHLRLPMASTTKVMTALLALEKGSLTDRIRVRAEDLQPLEGTESSRMWVDIGQEWTLEQLLWGLLLPSGNDAAMVIADYIGKGSIQDFVKMMNARAVELGLKDTHFVNPHGLDADGHYTSAYDLTVMAREALKFPVFDRMARTAYYVIEGPRDIPVANTNRFLRYPDIAPGVDGVKTGFTDNALQCIVASATRGGRRVLVTTLGSLDYVNDTKQLIDYAFGHYTWTRLYPPAGQAEISTGGAEQDVVYAFKEPRFEMVPNWQGQYMKLRVTVDRRPEQAADPSTTAQAIYALGNSALARPSLYSRPLSQ